jgi:hypothetical protein
MADDDYGGEGYELIWVPTGQRTTLRAATQEMAHHLEVAGPHHFPCCR